MEKFPTTPVSGVMQAESIEECRLLVAQSTRNIDAKREVEVEEVPRPKDSVKKAG